MTPTLLSNLALYCAVTIFFGAFTGLKCTFPLIRPFYFDRTLSDWEQALHHGLPVWDLFHAMLDHPWSNLVVFWVYYTAWPCILAFSPLVAAFLGDRRLRRRYLLSYILCWILLGTIAALLFMSAGPIFYERVTGDAQRYHPMQTYLQSRGMAWGPNYLWRVYQHGTIEPGAGISDFPSMHVGISTLATCLAWAIRRWIGVLMTIFTALVVMSSIYLGWHYAIGDYVVVPTACLLWWATGPRKLPRLVLFARAAPALA